MEYCIASVKKGLTKQIFIDGLKKHCEKSGWYGGKYDYLKDKIKNETDEEKKKQYKDKLEKYLNWRLSTIYRINTTTAYLSGKYRQMTKSSSLRPIWVYSAVMDNRTRPEHSSLNGKAFRNDDSFWDMYYPPNGWNCRCAVYSITESEARARGINIEYSESGEPPDLEYQDNEGNNKKINWNTFCPDEWRYNPGKQKFLPDWSSYSNLNKYQLGVNDKGKNIKAIDVVKESYIDNIKNYQFTKGEWDYFIDDIQDEDHKMNNIDMLASVLDKKISDKLKIDSKIYVTDGTLWHSLHKDSKRKSNDRIYPEWDDLKKTHSILKNPKYICKEKRSDTYFWIDDYDEENVISVVVSKSYVKTIKITPKKDALDKKIYDIYNQK